MTEFQWKKLADTVFSDSALTTRFARGHAMCTNTQILHRATGFAAWKHDGQYRKGEGAMPYIHHPIEVTAILFEVGDITDLDVLQSALLHDTIEDTRTTAGELELYFNARIRGLVLEVTDDKNLLKHERKALQIEHAPHLSAGAQAIKLADKISNVTDVAFAKPIDWAVEKQLEYFDWATQVVAGLRGCNPALEAAFDKQVAESRSAVTG
jgi:guanosine-3',5'-bis(diphosphate) 3'-pyrophosphohydrolase